MNEMVKKKITKVWKDFRKRGESRKGKEAGNRGHRTETYAKGKDNYGQGI